MANDKNARCVKLLCATENEREEKRHFAMQRVDAIAARHGTEGAKHRGKCLPSGLCRSDSGSALMGAVRNAVLKFARNARCCSNPSRKSCRTFVRQETQFRSQLHTTRRRPHSLAGALHERGIDVTP